MLFAVMLLPASGAAQSSPDVDKETAKQVLKLLRKGKKAYKQEDYQQAYDLFSKAYGKWSRPEILLRLGKSAEELGNPQKAHGHYKTFLDKKPDAKIRPKIEEKLATLEKKLPARVTWRATPEGVEVFGEDGEKILGKTPLEVEISPGEHTYVFRAEGYRERTKTIEVEGNETRTVAVRLEEIQQQAELSPRQRAIAKKKAEDQAAQRAAKPLTSWGWAAGATGLAGVGTGVVFSILQNSTVQEVNGYQRGASGATRSEYDSLKAQAQSHHRIAVIGYAAGGALTAAGTGMLLHQYFIRNSGSKKQVRATPQFGTAGGGGWAGLRLTF